MGVDRRCEESGESVAIATEGDGRTTNIGVTLTSHLAGMVPGGGAHLCHCSFGRGQLIIQMWGVDSKD